MTVIYIEAPYVSNKEMFDRKKIMAKWEIQSNPCQLKRK